MAHVSDIKMSFPRASGILLHPTSLPSRCGIGDLGIEAYRFADFLAASGQNLWQVLPLGPTGYGNSPYQSLSAFAGNALLISPQSLVAEELLTENDLEDSPPFTDELVDYAAARTFKDMLLRKASEKFQQGAATNFHSDFDEFCARSSSWLDNYSLFSALKDAHAGAEWAKWDRELSNREPAALD